MDLGEEEGLLQECHSFQHLLLSPRGEALARMGARAAQKMQSVTIKLSL